MAVKPLPQGTFKVFRLVGVGKLDKYVQIADADGNHGTPTIAFPPSATFIGQTRIFDAEEKDVQKRHKTLKYVTGTETYSEDGGKTFKEREVVGNLEFDDRGRCLVRWNDPISKLEYLMRSNESGSNPFRDPSTPAIWEEVESVSQSVQNDYERELWILDAKNLINGSDYAGLRQIAAARGIADPNDIFLIKKQLFADAETNPKEIIKGGNNLDLRRKIHVEDAINFKIVEFDYDTQEWHFTDNMPETLIVKATTEENIKDALVRAINEDKKKHTRMANANKNHIATFQKQTA